MPTNLHKGNRVPGKKSTYRITSDDRFVGGQSIGYYIEDNLGTKLFLKMFIEPTARSRDAKSFVARQHALIRKLAELPDFVCQDIEFFERDGIYYKVSERMEGVSLQQRFWDAAFRPDPQFWTQSDRQLNANILAYTIAEIHSHGLAHLDLKPENCYLAEKTIEATGHRIVLMRLLDFDGALIDGAPPPTRTLGTENYWSPEHLNPDKFGRPGKPSDVFTLGIMLYQLLARRYPFVSRRGFESRATDHPSTVAPWLSNEVADVIWRALSPQPSARPTAQEVHQALVGGTRADSAPMPTEDRIVRVALVAGGRRVRFWKDAILGRDNFRGIAGCEYVARRQAHISQDTSGWVISPLDGAANPTRLNGNLLDVGKRYPLREGDILEVGRFKASVGFEFES